MRAYGLEELGLSGRKDTDKAGHGAQRLLDQDDALHEGSNALRRVLLGRARLDALHQEDTMLPTCQQIRQESEAPMLCASSIRKEYIGCAPCAECTLWSFEQHLLCMLVSSGISIAHSMYCCSCQKT